MYHNLRFSWLFLQEAEKACKNLNGKLALSRKLKVDWAREHITTGEVSSLTVLEG